MTKEPTIIPPHLLQQWLQLAPVTPQDSYNAREAWLINHAYAAGVVHGLGARPAIQPVPVIERWPGPEDCDAEGSCWWFDPHADGAWYVDYYQGNYTHWLPASALPTPEADRLPKPPSAVAQAETLIERHALNYWVPSQDQWHTIREGLAEGRRALEALPNDIK